MFIPKKTLVALVALTACLSLNKVTLGQFKELPIAKTATGETTKAQNMLKKKEPVDAAILQRYVKNEMAKLTIVKESTSFASARYNLLLNIRSASDDAAKKAAADIVISYSNGILGSANFHPASRVNAMVALTELDSAANVPYPATYAALLGHAKNETLPIHLRSIAIYGLTRHAKLSKLPDATKNELSKEMAVIVASQPKSSLDVRAHAWMVRRSFDVLTTLGTGHAIEPALARLVNDKELPSIRLAAADYLPRTDLSKLTDAQKTQLFIGLAQLIEQQLVGWYEDEEDKVNIKSGGSGGGMGGMPGMGGEGGMGMPGMGGEGGGMGGYGEGGSGMAGYGEGGGGGKGMGMGGGFGEGGMGMGGMGGPKPKALDTQPWEVRMARRQVNQLLQTAHIALDGKATKEGRVVLANKPMLDLGLPAEVSTAAGSLLKAIDSLQNRVNDSTKITTMTTLLGQSKKPIETVMDLVRDVPALTAQYPKYQVKDELNEVSEEGPAGAADPAAPGDGAAGAEGGEAAAAGDAGAVGAGAGAPEGAPTAPAGAPAAGAGAKPAAGGQ